MRFGYGLSYTTFEMSKLSIEATDGSILVTTTVTTTGSLLGKEVVQVHFQPNPYQGD